MRRCLLAAAGIALVVAQAAWAEENWPQWRGPHTNGVTEAAGLPTEWSETKNIVWKVPLPWWAGSSPIVWGDRIFLTSPAGPGEPAGAAEPQPQSAPAKAPGAKGPGGKGQGAKAQRGGGGAGGGGGGARLAQKRDPGSATILLFCINRADGKTLWSKPLDTSGNAFFMKQNMASPSPVTDGQVVVAMTGNGEVASFDFQGNELWRRNLQKEYGPFGLKYGYGSSPLLWEDRVIIPVMHGTKTDAPSYLVAIDTKTGQNVWKVERVTDAPDESPDAYTTPALMTLDGQPVVVINGADYVTGNDPKTGEEFFRAPGLNPDKVGNFRIVPSCAIAGDWIFAPTRKKPLCALQAKIEGGKPTAQVVWKSDFGPDEPSPVSDGKHLWILDENGLLQCVEVASGKPLFEMPQHCASGKYDSSLVMADGKIYATNEKAQTTVLAATPEFKVLATNQLDDDYTLSTLAIAGKQIFLRTSGNLYCIAQER
ncbi:MAG: PQQ-binding-like beta-propeller repeat protein [Candidatus Sumerlaeota bacterium]|nr:PQQ-binding-like beta-propeller repeat protein [Candidatus Sumerlaeota bacterium]